MLALINDVLMRVLVVERSKVSGQGSCSGHWRCSLFWSPVGLLALGNGGRPLVMVPANRSLIYRVIMPPISTRCR